MHTEPSATSSGQYTVPALASLVDFAALRGVHLIPELDSPGGAQFLCATHAEVCTEPVHPPPPPPAMRRWGAQPVPPPPLQCFKPTPGQSRALMAEVLGVVWGLFNSSGVVHLGGDNLNPHCWHKDTNLQEWLGGLPPPPEPYRPEHIALVDYIKWEHKLAQDRRVMVRDVALPPPEQGNPLLPRNVVVQIAGQATHENGLTTQATNQPQG